ncbi:unnamed protein product [Discosporangium mesarthrocarpum]
MIATEHVAGDTPGVDKVMGTVLCCMCSLPIAPNPTSMCVQCIRTKVDITEGIGTNLTLHECRGCKRYLRPPWVEAKLESRELMALCLRKVVGLKKVKLVDAAWIWTEPHSKRLKLKLTVQKEVGNGAILQQVMIVTFVVRNQQCNDCAAVFSDGTWKAVVQVRQRVDHKRTFFYLEQLILKHDAHSQCINVQIFKDGMDFYFKERNHAARFTDFLEGVVPCRTKNSKKLVSADNHSNVFKFHHTHLVTLLPVCKDDLVLLPRRVAEGLGCIARLVVVQRISSAVHVVDPVTAQTADVTEEKYARQEFPALLSSTRLTPYIVLGTEAIPHGARPGMPARRRARKSRLAEVEVARESDLGKNDTRFRTTSHLGHLLRAGDTVLGYDLAAANLADEEADSLHLTLPDVVLVRKVYPRNNNGEERDGEVVGAVAAGGPPRHWKLRGMEMEGGGSVVRSGGGGASTAREEEAVEKDFETFLQQLDGDREMRRQVNLYRAGPVPIPAGAKEKMGGALVGVGNKEDEMDEEEVRLEELLGELTLDDAGADPDGQELGSLFSVGAAPAPNEDAAGLVDRDLDDL